MIVLLMIGVFASLVFLCVSPMIAHFASRGRDHAAPSKSHPVQKHTFSAR